MSSRLIIGALILIAVLIGAGWHFSRPHSSMPVIGILHPTAVHKSAVSSFIDKMREHGYEDGDTVTYLYDGPTGPGKSLKGRAQELVANGATLIYAASTPATKAALEAVQGTDIVVVFGPVNDPVGAKFIDSLRRPGGGVTGVTLAPSTAKRLAWFKEFDPAIERILVPFNPDDRSSISSLNRVKAVAQSLDLDLEIKSVRSPLEVRELFEDLPDDIDGVFLPRDSMINSAITDIIDASIAKKLLLSGPGYNQVKRGALFSYGVRQAEVGIMVARLVQEVLSGTDPAIIPVETVDSYLFINTETARALGLSLSPALLSQADTLLP